MTIRSNIMALVAVFTVVLFMAPAANAQEKTDTQQAPKEPAKVKIQEGDTLSSVADAHSTTYVRLYNANPNLSNPDSIDIGNEIRIPTADEQLPDRYSEYAAQQAAVAASTQTAAASNVSYEPSYSQTYTPGAQAVYATDSAGNTYFKGYCTWYVKDRRPDLPNQLGNGGQWVASAAAQGRATGSTPQVGAVAETSGHVAYVEAVNADGTITISEMNGTAGFGNVGTRNVPASQYQYIY